MQAPGAELLPPEDKGRYAVTNVASDEYLFKAPSLRNVGLTPPYFHSGAVWELDRAVQVMGVAQLGADLQDAGSMGIGVFFMSLTGWMMRFPSSTSVLRNG